MLSTSFPSTDTETLLQNVIGLDTFSMYSSFPGSQLTGTRYMYFLWVELEKPESERNNIYSLSLKLMDMVLQYQSDTVGAYPVPL